jgi:hypothetical protein
VTKALSSKQYFRQANYKLIFYVPSRFKSVHALHFEILIHIVDVLILIIMGYIQAGIFASNAFILSSLFNVQPTLSMPFSRQYW